MSRKIRGSAEPVETKAKRIAIGATIAGVLLIVVLVVFLIIQFVQIGVVNAETRKYEKEQEYYSQLNDDLKDDLDFYKTQEGLRMLAVMNGWKKNPSGK